jgi:hypothetical protein
MAAAILASPHSAQAQRRFSDAFELHRFWTIFEQNGSVALSSDVSRSGRLALKMASRSGGQRYIWVTHAFRKPVKGSVSVWIYDTPAGRETLYAGLFANYADPRGGFGVNVADWNPTHYVWGGPGVSETSTSVPRSVGWHEFKLRVTSSGFDALIDGIVVGSIPGEFKISDVRLQVSGPVWRPDAAFYFDDFQFTRSR